MGIVWYIGNVAVFLAFQDLKRHLDIDVGVDVGVNVGVSLGIGIGIDIAIVTGIGMVIGMVWYGDNFRYRC